MTIKRRFSPETGARLRSSPAREGGHANLWTLDVATHKVKRLTKGSVGRFSSGIFARRQVDRLSHPIARRLYQTARRALGAVAPDRCLCDAAGRFRDCGMLVEARRFLRGAPSGRAMGRRSQPLLHVGRRYILQSPGVSHRASRGLASIDVASGTMTDIPAGPGGGYVAGVRVAPMWATCGRTWRLRAFTIRRGRKGPSGVVRSASWTRDGSRVIYERIVLNDRIQRPEAVEPRTGFPGIADVV